MALIVKNRVQESTTTTGTGALTLAGAYTGYQRFSAVMSTNDTCYYTIEALDSNGNPSGDWECGLGTYSGTNTLTRTTVTESSNGGSAVNLSAGTKRVMLSATATHLGLFNQKANNLSDVASASTARTNLSAAASGAATGSGLTMATARLLGRTTASTGALEEISVGTGLSLVGRLAHGNGKRKRLDISWHRTDGNRHVGSGN
jgi:hypothetical protein